MSLCEGVGGGAGDGADSNDNKERVVFFISCIDRLYLSHRGKKDKERGKGGAVIANRKKEVGVSKKSAKKYGHLPIYFLCGGSFNPLAWELGSWNRRKSHTYIITHNMH